MRSVIVAVFIAALGVSPARAESDSMPVVTVYKSPTCGCCSKWVDHLKANGFKVAAFNVDDVTQHKSRLGVPPAMGSCHTAEVAGYVVEGHVPAQAIQRLLRERPAARGLTVPGMPQGSPGMEGPRKDAFDVLLIDPRGSTRVFAHY